MFPEEATGLAELHGELDPGIDVVDPLGLPLLGVEEGDDAPVQLHLPGHLHQAIRKLGIGIFY